MAKKKQVQKEKPREILDLERAFGITLHEENESNKYEVNSYVVNLQNQIINIYLYDQGIKDLSPIKKLVHLESIDLSENNIEDISTLFPLSSLKTLVLYENRITKFEPLLQSPTISELLIDANPISDPSVIGKLLNLEILSCGDTNIDNINFVGELKKLEFFYASFNRISNIAVINQLPSLKKVDFYRNTITEIPSLENLKLLDSFNLGDNLIKEVPRNIAERFNWLKDSNTDGFDADFGIILSDNPLTFPPISVIELGPETVKSYYEMAEDFGHKPLSEGRILFVGDGSSGKSSIIEKIIYNTFQKGRPQTNGIKLEHLHLQHPEDERDLVFHIWDFGGQEIQHAVHKFFFTEGCLYVLVLDNRKEEEPEYWLQQIESLGGKAPVLVVFNKQDENAAETVDRKYLKEKYPNIVGFYNTSCFSGFGIDDFKRDLEAQAIKLRTVEEQFPQNWFAIKKAIEERTSGRLHYLTYETYREICVQNHVEREEIQKLLLRYLTTIGAVTWFGDTYLNFMHVLSPAWITQGVYKIITAKKTAHLFGQIEVSDFKELLQPINPEDYIYQETHYGYILSMMKKFDLCYTPDDKTLLIPSAFGKAPKVEYSDFRGEQVRTYILQFVDYMPLALIHKYIAKKLPDVYDNNFWYSGIVIKDCKSDSLAMVHADKEAKRIYIRIKGESPLGMWEHVRREFSEITSNYANIKYKELVSLDDSAQNVVDYEDLVSHLKARKATYFHPKLVQEFNVGYLMGMFESKETSLQKIEKGTINVLERQEPDKTIKVPPVIVNILNNNSPTVKVNTQINVDIDVQVINNISSELKGDAAFLLDELKDSNKELRDAVAKLIQFADDAKAAQNSGELKETGWTRRLKGIMQTLKNGKDAIQNVQDGGEILKNIFHQVAELSQQFNLHELANWIKTLMS